MNQFFKFVFASCLGSLLALIALTLLGFFAIAGLASSIGSMDAVKVKPNSVLTLDFDAAIPEKTNNIEMDPFSLEDKDVPGLTEIRKAIASAKEDKNIKGIYLNLSTVPGGKATIAAIRDALADFRSSGKFIVSYAHAYSQDAYYLASVADSILLNPIGAVDFRGYATILAFFKNMLDRGDVQVRVFYAGKFKSATEPFRVDKMSDENRTQIREYVNALYDIMIRDIAASRKISETRLREIADNYDGRRAESALKAGLIDRIAYEDEAIESVRSLLGLSAKDKLSRVRLSDYCRTLVGKNKIEKDKIAVVYAEGGISDGDTDEPGSIIDGPYVRILRKIRKDDKVKALVLRINSPGGSVMASENILREVQLCKAAGKPVVVSMGDVAASGGYYIACQADSIFAEESTITGSIGVFGLIPILDKTLRNKIGITFDSVRTAKYSAFGTPFYDFSPDESRMIQAEIDRVYDDFLGRVAKGRNMSVEQVNEIAQGRVWPGRKAKEIGLVDDIAGLDRAVAAAASLAGLEKYYTTEYPRTKTGLQQLLEKIGSDKPKDDEITGYLARRHLSPNNYTLYKEVRDLSRNTGIQARLPWIWSTY
ncbi:MAG: signal peptide peptidase SppA [Saprospiraceae bacterium]